MRRALALLLLCACGEQLEPETLVDKLRVLSITCEPPEVSPGQSSALSILELDPSRPGGKTTVVWVGCEPDAYGLGRSACNDTSSLLQPTSFTDFPPGVKILGIGNKAAYASSPTLFDPIAMGDSNRFNGVVGQVLAVVIGEEIDPASTNAQLHDLFDRIEHQQVQSVYALTRITVSEKDPKNQNPLLTGLEVGGAPLPKNGTIQVEPGEMVTLHVSTSAAETYQLQLQDHMEQRTETLVGAWYSTSGRYSLERFDLASEDDPVFTAPGAVDIPEDPVPAKRNGTMWLVLRDGRGGQSFSTLPFFVCDDSLPDPAPASVEVSSTGTVTLRGKDMSSALDVVANGIALQRGAYSPAQDAFLGDLPPELMAGTYALEVRTKKCSTLGTSLMLTVP